MKNRIPKTYYYFPYPYDFKIGNEIEKLTPDIEFLEQEISLFKLHEYNIKIVRAERIYPEVYVLFNNSNIYLTREEYDHVMESYCKFKNARESYRISSFIYMIRKENGLL